MKNKELRVALERILTRDRNYILAYQNESNPQIAIMVLQARERVDMADSVLRAMDGDKLFLDLL
jgi:hypothetical protein